MTLGGPCLIRPSIRAEHLNSDAVIVTDRHRGSCGCSWWSIERLRGDGVRQGDRCLLSQPTCVNASEVDTSFVAVDVP
jgi:hypothetical protein